MTKCTAITIAAVIGLLAAPALADWAPGDGHKMHFPQLPDPGGWGISHEGAPNTDDWQCSQTGPVEGIHFWISSPGDQPFDIASINVRIVANVPPDHPENPYGQDIPNFDADPLWSVPALDTFTLSGPWSGVQGWDMPYLLADQTGPDESPVYPDHNQYWQVSIEDIASPFIQQEGETYWLAWWPEMNHGEIGWNTSQDHFNGWGIHAGHLGGIVAVDTDDHPTDFAFVVTPEPTTLSLLALGGLALLRKRRG